MRHFAQVAAFVSLALAGSALGTTYNWNSTGTMDNTGTNNTNRFADGTGISSFGGGISFLGNASAASSETLGALTLTTGSTTVRVQHNAGTSFSTVLTFASLTGTTGSVNFV